MTDQSKQNLLTAVVYLAVFSWALWSVLHA
jgi:hypothetical protein